MAGGVSNIASSLTPQQMAALQEHLRQQRAQGHEVNAQMIQEWIVANRIQLPGAAQAQAQAPQQQPQAPNQQNAQDLINRLFPPNYAPNSQQALAHLQAVLFPQGSSASTSPLLQQVMTLASAGRLTSDQMNALKSAVAIRNGQPSQQQQQPQPGPSNVQPQQQSSAPSAAAAAAAAVQGNPNASQAIQQLQQRITNIETLLSRQDISDEQRQKLNTELEGTRAQLQRVVKMLLAANQQGNQNLQQAQQLAMAQRIEAQRQQAATTNNNPQYRTASPAFQQSQAGQNSHQQQTPSRPAAGPKPIMSQAQQKAAAQAQGPARQGQAQQALASATRPAGAPAGSGQGGYVGLGSSATSSSIPSVMSISPASAEAFPAPRPTLTSGLAHSTSLSSPAITRPPGYAGSTPSVLNPVDGSSASGTGSPAQGASSLAANAQPGIAGSAPGGAGAGAAAAGSSKPLRPSDLRPDDSRGRTVTKRKIRELVESIDPNEKLSDEVEDLLLEVADEFIDSMTRFGCQLAKHRKSDRLEVKDLALHLERSYGIKVPGFQPEEAKAQRRLQVPPGYAGRLQAAKDVARKRASNQS